MIETSLDELKICKPEDITFSWMKYMDIWVLKALLHSQLSTLEFIRSSLSIQAQLIFFLGIEITLLEVLHTRIIQLAWRVQKMEMILVPVCHCTTGF